jgi:hypothetical protein
MSGCSVGPSPASRLAIHQTAVQASARAGTLRPPARKGQARRLREAIRFIDGGAS